MGGGNSMRPGGPQPYGSSFGQQQQQQPGQQQPSPFAPQPTGFGQAPPPLQNQYTGFPGMQQPQPQAPGQLQPQFTGFPGQQPAPQQVPFQTGAPRQQPFQTGAPQQQPFQTGAPQQQPFQTGAPQQQPFQTGAPPMPAIPQQYQSQFNQQQQQLPQQTGFNATPTQQPQQQQPPQPAAPSPAPIKPQATGFSQMAASFRTGGNSAPVTSSAPAPKSTKIPNIRLSFITAADQVKFETLFKQAVGDNEQTMSGEKARDLLMRSRLDGDSLSQIWYVGHGSGMHLTINTRLILLFVQDSRRYHTIWTAPFPRIRAGHVPLQPKNDRSSTSE